MSTPIENLENSISSAQADEEFVFVPDEEKRNAELEAENKRLKKQVASLKSAVILAASMRAALAPGSSHSSSASSQSCANPALSAEADSNVTAVARDLSAQDNGVGVAVSAAADISITPATKVEDSCHCFHHITCSIL